MLNYEEAINILRKLKNLAKHVRENDNYIRMDFLSHDIEDEKRDIIETLAKLDLD